jgi:hypothetical protein
MEEFTIEVLAESESFSTWRALDPDGEMVYHLEVGPVTIHFFQEDWDEFQEVIAEAGKRASEG